MGDGITGPASTSTWSIITSTKASTTAEYSTYDYYLVPVIGGDITVGCENNKVRTSVDIEFLKINPFFYFSHLKRVSTLGTGRWFLKAFRALKMFQIDLS